MAFTKYTKDTKIIGALGTNPAERGLTTQEFKDKFDQFADEFVAWFNETHVAEANAHLAEITQQINSLDALHEVGLFARDATLTGTQKITTSKKPKAIIFQATVGTAPNKISWGMSSRTNNQCIAGYGNVTADSYTRKNEAIEIIDSDGNRTMGKVTLLEDNGFTITWAHLGTGATGSITVIYMVIY